MTSSSEILVRATIRLAGLPHGDLVYVDPSDPYIADLLRHGYLVAATADDADDAHG